VNGWTPPHPGDELPIPLARLRNAVARELHAQLALRGEVVRLADVPHVALSVAVQLEREFRIEEPSSGGAGRDDDESLGLDGAAFYGSALPDGSDLPAERYPIFDHGWPLPPGTTSGK
jgi:hypothetical protein